jgi:hypothetical protein
MDLYLVQHGVAYSKEEDPTRPLSDVGRFEVTAVAPGGIAELRVDRPEGQRRAVRSGELRLAGVADSTTAGSDGGASCALCSPVYSDVP